MTMPNEDELMSRLNVSRETLARMQNLAGLLTKWNTAINLVSKTTISDVWSRHILDSAQIFGFGSEATLWADLGSGGGFPGLVVAILAAEKAPQMRFVLLESDQRKAAFLRQANQNLGLRADIIAERIEKIDPLGADVVSARALAPLPQLCAFGARHGTSNGAAIFLKGKSYREELAMARKDWNFSLECQASITDSSAIVLVLRGISHV